MKLATWNVNSIRQRLPHVLDWLNANEPDVLALQEIKAEADKFPLAEIEASDGPPPGVDAERMQMLYDSDRKTSLFIAYFQTASELFEAHHYE